MIQFTAASLVELLDRKYRFVVNTPLDNFMLDLKMFIEFLTSHELIVPFTNKIVHGVNAEYERYKKQLEKETKTAIELRDEFIVTYPDLDDTNAQRQTIADLDYDYTFSYFNRVLTESYRTGIPLEPGIMDDDSDVYLLIKILGQKTARARETQGDHFNQELDYKIEDLAALHDYTHKEWFNYKRISPGSALAGLIGVVNRINPEPKDMSVWRGMTPEQKLEHAMKKYFDDSGYEWIKQATYDLIQDRFLESTNFVDKAGTLKNQLKRVYEGIRQEIGTTRLQLELLDRYRIRCQWYNLDELRRRVIDAEGKFVRNREDILTRDLSLYLYDQGVTAIYRPRFGKHEFDLLELDAMEPMFVEAKAYKDSDARADIIAGISQLHAYLSAYEAHKQTTNAYYVVYRLGGPNYELPRQIQTSRFTIYSLLIDLGTSEQSGRRQPQPVIISVTELMEGINKAVSTEPTQELSAGY